MIRKTDNVEIWVWVKLFSWLDQVSSISPTNRSICVLYWYLSLLFPCLPILIAYVSYWRGDNVLYSFCFSFSASINSFTLTGTLGFSSFGIWILVCDLSVTVQASIMCSEALSCTLELLDWSLFHQLWSSPRSCWQSELGFFC